MPVRLKPRFVPSYLNGPNHTSSCTISTLLLRLRNWLQNNSTEYLQKQDQNRGTISGTVLSTGLLEKSRSSTCLMKLGCSTSAVLRSAAKFISSKNTWPSAPTMKSHPYSARDAGHSPICRGARMLPCSAPRTWRCAHPKKHLQVDCDTATQSPLAYEGQIGLLGHTYCLPCKLTRACSTKRLLRSWVWQQKSTIKLTS